MSFTSKKRGSSKPDKQRVDKDIKLTNDEMNNGSLKRKKRKRLYNQPPNSDASIASINNNIEINIQSPPIDSCIMYRSKCPCETHYTKHLIEHTYDIPVDQLYDLIFGSNDFVRSYRTAQKFFEQTETEWMRNEQSNALERTLYYKVPFESRLMGKSIISTREKQIRSHDVAGSYYIIETEVYNQGVKYCDTFCLLIRFCIVQISPTTSKLLVTAQIRYVKSVGIVIKHFIEGSAFTASQNGLKDLHGRLSSRKSLSNGNYSLSNGAVIVTESIVQNNHYTSQSDALPVHQTVFNNNINNQNTISIDHDQIMYILIFLVSILSVIHIYLYNKLSHTESLLERLTHALKV